MDSRSPASAEDKLRGNDDSVERRCLANDATTRARNSLRLTLARSILTADVQRLRQLV